MTPVEIGLLLGWGLLVGLDLISLPQMMIARPFVAASVAGALLGDFQAGLRVGLVLELFQLDVLPVGASRYPEFGTAGIAAAAVARQVPGVLGLGLATLTGLCMGAIGGASVHLLRRYNAHAVGKWDAAIERGDRHALVGAHLAALLRDAGRAVAVTGFGLGLAAVVVLVAPGLLTLRGAALVTAVAAGAAIAAGLSGGLRLAGPGTGRAWFAVGALCGLAVAMLR